MLVDLSLGLLSSGYGLILILKMLWHGPALEKVVTLEVSHRLVDELNLVGIRICGRSSLSRWQMLAMNASEPQAAYLDVAGDASLLAASVGILLVGKEEFQLLTDKAYSQAEAHDFIVGIGHWHR